MSAHCCSDNEGPSAGGPSGDPAYRRVLWIVLAINAVMFLVEMAAGLVAGSMSLQADALDFLADTANYGLSLFVLGMALRVRARAAMVKGGAMALFGCWVLAGAAWHMVQGTQPDPVSMGVVGVAALAANATVFGLLWVYRAGDSNMRSVWLCSRNDVLGNCAVLLAAVGVFGTGTGWPDIVVALIMAGLALQGAVAVLRHAARDLEAARTEAAFSRR